MARRQNTDIRGNDFTGTTVAAIWLKATSVAGYDPAEWRKDRCGAWIRRSAYGDTTSTHGWEIDHGVPVAKGGGDVLSNLQPLHWQNNRHKADDYPSWSCKVSAI